MRFATALTLGSAAVTTVSAFVAPWGNSFSIADVQEGPVKPQASWNFVDCGLPTDVIQIESLTISPDPPEPGKNLTVTVSATATERIEKGATADVTVKIGLVKLLTKTLDICDEAEKANADIQCPVEEGHHTVVQTVALPKEIPPAKFLVSVRAYTVDEDDLACADILVDFRKGRF